MPPYRYVGLSLSSAFVLDSIDAFIGKFKYCTLDCVFCADTTGVYHSDVFGRNVVEALADVFCHSQVIAPYYLESILGGSCCTLMHIGEKRGREVGDGLSNTL